MGALGCGASGPSGRGGGQASPDDPIVGYWQNDTGSYIFTGDGRFAPDPDLGHRACVALGRFERVLDSCVLTWEAQGDHYLLRYRVVHVVGGDGDDEMQCACSDEPEPGYARIVGDVATVTSIPNGEGGATFTRRSSDRPE